MGGRAFKVIINRTSRLRVSHPSGIVALSGYLKRLTTDGTGKTAVYCRGECILHESLFPSLFRKVKFEEEIDILVQAEKELEQQVQKRFGGRMRRFRERHISAILQHYGVRTSWIDLIDNLYVAVWFPLNERNTLDAFHHKYSKSPYRAGWIHFIQARVAGQPALRIRDLRSDYLPLNLRPHAQHGISATRWSREHWNFGNKDLSTYIVASVEIPNESKFWRLSGYMFQQAFFFPAPSDDHTYSVLLKNEMATLLQELEKCFGLTNLTFGRIDRYEHSISDKLV